MKVLDLFSGIGGFSLGLERAGMETVAFCEIEDYPQRVLKKHWPDVPIYNDVRTLTKERLDIDGIGPIDLICGGYPCQPFSNAGKRKGQDDDRHLWPEVNRLIQEYRPSWFIGENVAGHITMGLDNVLSDLEGAGYSWETFIIPACAIDAPHRRDRVWIVAHAECTKRRASESSTNDANRNNAERQETASGTGSSSKNGGKEAMGNTEGKRCGEEGESRSRPAQRLASTSTASIDVADTKGKRYERLCNSGNCGQESAGKLKGGGFSGGTDSAWRSWPAEPGVGRVVNGLPCRVDRLKGLGNAVVPQIPEIIGRAIMEIENGY